MVKCRRDSIFYLIGFVFFVVTSTPAFAAPSLNNAIIGLFVWLVIGLLCGAVSSGTIAWFLVKKLLPSSYLNWSFLLKIAGIALVVSLILFIPTKVLVFKVFGDFYFGYGSSLTTIVIWQLVVILILVLRKRGNNH